MVWASIFSPPAAYPGNNEENNPQYKRNVDQRAYEIKQEPDQPEDDQDGPKQVENGFHHFKL